MTSLLLLLMTSLLLLLAASRRQVSGGRTSALVSDHRFTINALKAKRKKNQNGKWCLSGIWTAFRLLGLFFTLSREPLWTEHVTLKGYFPVYLPVRI
jgi:hypothetical protein